MKTAIKLSLCFSLYLSTLDYAVAITTDIVPTAPTTITPAIHASPGSYTINGGQPIGSDTLLQTFSKFNLASPDTVTFANSASYTNLIVRVTAGASTIDGQLTSLIPNFYFINPAGVTFGPNAVIDVPGAFHVSTADKMTIYQDTGTPIPSYLTYLIDAHSTTPVSPLPGSTLGVAPPGSFGFLGGSNSSVTVAGSTLSVKPEKVFDIVANNINIGTSTTTASLAAPSGEMRLVAFKGTGDVSVDASTLPEQSLLATNGGDITISNSSNVTSEGGYTRLWGGNINLNNGDVSANSTATSTGSVTIRGDTINITNTGSITTSTTSASANTPAGNIDVKANTLNIIGNTSTSLTGISSSALSSTGNGGTVTVNSNILNIQNGGAIRTATFTNGNAGATNVTANVLTIDGQGNTSAATGITSRANLGSVGNTGNAGTVVVSAGNLTILNAGQISTDTFTRGNAGTVIVNANSILVDGVVKNSSGAEFPSKISSGTRTNSRGYTGDVSVTASKSIQLTNGGNIGIQSLVTNHTGATPPLTESAITITAPDISLTNSKITSSATNSAGTVIDNAGDINVNFSHWLTLNSSFITTTANTGNGGIITINGGEAIYLENSGFLTSVSGATSNGGNINVTADALIMNTAVIQANAVGGSGGDINISLEALIPSQNRLIVGGKRVLWQPNIPGFNVIQAASESGVSGTVNVNSPQFDISGSVSGLDTSGLVLPNITQNPCASQGTRSSSLARGSKGGIPVNESKAGFIPAAAGALPDAKAKAGSAKNDSDTTVLAANSVTAQNNPTCTPI